MSFILDALRKSEAARRRRSEAPDLFATMPQAAEPERARHAWPLWAIAGIGVLSLIVAIWLVSRRPTMPPPSTESATARVDDTRTPTSEAPPPVMAAPIAADSPPVVERPVTPTAPVATPAPVASVPAAEPVIAMPATAAPREPPPPAPPTDAPRTNDPPVNDRPMNDRPVNDRPTALADLDPATRNQLPPLKLSMHLWNETPSGRFVILDGQRLKEGDVLGELVIERITRDGAVLVWRGVRLKIALQ